MGIKLRSKPCRLVTKVYVDEDGDLSQEQTMISLRMGDIANMLVGLSKGLTKHLPKYFEHTSCRVNDLAFESIDITTCFERAVGIRKDFVLGVTAYKQLVKVCLQVDHRLRSAPIRLSPSNGAELLNEFYKQI